MKSQCTIRLTYFTPVTYIIFISGVLVAEGFERSAKMKLAILCLCLASTASAAPSFFHYMPHYAGPRQQAPPTQVKNVYTAGVPLPQTGIPGAYSVELIYPHTFGAAGGATPGQTTHGFIKYSIPQPPGRQSVEVYYPYDFTQQQIITSIPPMSNVPYRPNLLPFEHPPQNIPQQIPNIPTFDASPLPSQDPLPPLQQDQPTQTSQVPVKV